MRVGVYVDGFNLYYGAKYIVGGSGQPGWRWLDLRVLSGNLVTQYSGWPGATVSRVVYCTARISGAGNPAGQRDQDTYLRALKQHNAVEIVAEGFYVNPAKGYPTGALNGSPRDGVGNHWWWQLTTGDLTAAQLPTFIGKLTKPAGW